MTVTILEGNVLETLKGVPSCSVQCAVTSPPYYGLRDYGVEGQIGLEPSPEAYVEQLLNVFREVYRVLKDDGTLWLNLGDGYNGSGQKTNQGSLIDRPARVNGLKPKDLIGIPWMVAFALRADGWYLRQDIIWAKPNPMPESVTDRCTKAHEYIFLLSKSKTYYYNQEAILEPYSNSLDRWGCDFTRLVKSPKENQGNPVSLNRERNMRPNPNGRNKRSVWTVTTKPYKGAHFATFPPDLIEPCILAGSKEDDTVLDPFSGSGTTGEVSIKHNRHYIGCELNPDYVKLTERRLSKVQP